MGEAPTCPARAIVLETHFGTHVVHAGARELAAGEGENPQPGDQVVSSVGAGLGIGNNPVLVAAACGPMYDLVVHATNAGGYPRLESSHLAGEVDEESYSVPGSLLDCAKCK